MVGDTRTGLPSPRWKEEVCNASMARAMGFVWKASYSNWANGRTSSLNSYSFG